MSENKIMTAPKKTVGAESGQPDKNINGYSITDPSFFDKQELETMTMTELYNTCYQPGIPVIEGLLYKGIYCRCPQNRKVIPDGSDWISCKYWNPFVGF